MRTDQVLADARDLPKVLERFSHRAVQGTVARSGEVFVLAFDDALAEDRAALIPRDRQVREAAGVRGVWQNGIRRRRAPSSVALRGQTSG